MSRSLSEIEAGYWGNAILFQLAEALGKPAKIVGPVENPETVYEEDPNELLAEALEVIWMYKELSK